jgi:hypothetical protein
MKPASDKQISFAKTINWYTKIPLPLEETASAYWKYIQDNIEAYQKEYRYRKYEAERKCRDEKRNRKLYNTYMDDEEDSSWAAAMDFSWM